MWLPDASIRNVELWMHFYYLDKLFFPVVYGPFIQTKYDVLLPLHLITHVDCVVMQFL